MYLVIVILILLAWGIIKIVENIKYPQQPPIDDMEEHLKTLQSLPNQKARQKYLRDRARGKQKQLLEIFATTIDFLLFLCYICHIPIKSTRGTSPTTVRRPAQ